MMPRARLRSILAASAELGPVLAGLAVHGMAMSRWALAIPAAVTILLMRALGWSAPQSRLWTLGAGILGAAVGWGATAFLPTPEGPLPGVLLSTLTGGLLGSTVVSACSRRLFGAWTSVGVLVALSISAQPPGLVVRPLLAFALLMVVSLFTFERPQRAGGRGLWAFAGMLALVGLGTAGMARLMAASEGALFETILALIEEQPLAAQLSVQPWLALQPSSRTAVTERTVLELEGAPPTRLRTVVMDRFDGEKWYAPPEPTASAGPAPEVEKKLLDFEILFFRGMQGATPLPAGTVQVAGRPPAFTVGWLLAQNHRRGDRLRLQRTPEERLPPEARPEAETLMVPPEIQAALRPYVEAEVDPNLGPAARARALERYFTANFSYSLRTDLQGDAHPLVVLVRERRPAYCVYFASAMAVMLRIGGVPSRVVGGFLVPEPNGLTGITTVRERDAHAWVEAWMDDEQRWVAFDPTPSREAALASEGGALTALVRTLRDTVARLLLVLRSDPVGCAQRLLGACPVMAAAAFALGVLLWRRLRTRWAGPRGLSRGAGGPHPLAPHHRRFLRLLRKRLNLRVALEEVDDEILARLDGRLDQAAASALGSFIEHWRRARFGGQTAEGLAQALDDLERCLGPSRDGR